MTTLPQPAMPAMASNAATESASEAMAYRDRFLLLLSLTLCGYALFGKTVAYIGFPPIFIGEIVLLLGIIALVGANCFAAVIASVPGLCLAALISWTLFRTLPYVPAYRIDALRDSVTFMYGTLAVIVIALLLEDTRRLNRLISYYSRFVALLPPTMTVLSIIALLGRDILPKMPGAGQPIISLRPGDLGVHLAGAAIFVLFGFRRAGRLWLAFLVVAAVIAATQNRAGALAMMISTGVAATVGGKVRSLIPMVLVAGVVVSIAYAADITLPMAGEGKRPVSARQLVDNMVSMVDTSDQTLDGTKKWRVQWWHAIFDYTLKGKYFWTGKGFGINLAQSDGFVVGRENPDAPVLRSPHNVHMTVLARTGVPGLALWGATLFCWFAMLVSTAAEAYRNQERRWADFLLFLTCYLLAMLIDASFDIALEGPILGFWFWTVFGIGVASAMIYRARPVAFEADSLLCKI
jgi:hypothetical protein